MLKDNFKPKWYMYLLLILLFKFKMYVNSFNYICYQAKLTC